jgi:hypothetical protein
MRFLVLMVLAVLVAASRRYAARYRYAGRRRTARDVVLTDYLHMMADHRQGVWV